MFLFSVPYFLFSIFLGLCVGSFLNVVIDWSVGKRRSLFTPPSYCDHCKHQLGFWDLIPVFSFVFLRGKCRYCGKKIPLQYPLVELTTGFSFALSSYILYPIPYTLFLFSVFIVIFVTDLRYGLIPDRVILPATAIALPYSLFLISTRGGSASGGNNSLLAALLIAGSFFALYLFTQGRGLGLGDVKLGFFLGLTLGFPYAILAVWAAFVLGGMAAVVLLVLRRKKMKDEIPLGPFLVMGSVITMFFGKTILGYFLLTN